MKKRRLPVAPGMRRAGRIAGWLLLALCALTLVVSGVLSVPAKTADGYAASGREARLSPIVLPDGTVDVNGGDLDEITRLSGVGETIGQAILDERDAHGPFFYPEDLLVVRGIGDTKLEGFQDMLDLTKEEP
jgi:competence ComEA-like helix-hairpin-helix protein